jgi:hypothetical protein
MATGKPEHDSFLGLLIFGIINLLILQRHFLHVGFQIAPPLLLGQEPLLELVLE